jgi:hypothetical protein
MQAQAHLANGSQDENEEGSQHLGTKVLILNILNTSSKQDLFQQQQRDQSCTYFYSPSTTTSQNWQETAQNISSRWRVFH